MDCDSGSSLEHLGIGIHQGLYRMFPPKVSPWIAGKYRYSLFFSTCGELFFGDYTDGALGKRFWEMHTNGLDQAL